MDYRHRLIHLSFALGLLAAQPAPGATLGLSTSTETPTAVGAGSGMVVLESLGTETPAVLEIDLARLPEHVDVPANSTWRIRLASSDLWSRQRTVFVPEAGATLQLHLLPAGRMSGSVEAAPGASLPATLTARFQSAPEHKETLPEEEEACDVTPETKTRGRFECRLPAGKLDLRLRARGFLTHYRWGFEVVAGKTRDAGKLELLPGAAVVGWVHPLADHRLTRCRVSLQPQQAGLPQNAAQRQRGNLLTATALVNDRGFFHLDGIAPGAYRLTIEHPAYAPFRVAPVTVLEDHEIELDAIELQPPSSLQVQVSPPTDPYHQPWSLTLSKDSPMPGFTDTVHDAEHVDEQGIWQTHQLEPVAHWLRVEDSRGAAWATETIEVSGAETHAEVELDAQRVEVRLRFAEEPLPLADVWFGGRFGTQSLHRRTNAEGTAYFFLPRRQEPWPVQVEAPAARVKTSFQAIRIPDEAEPGEPWVVLDLEVPATQLEGDVVTPDGEVVAQAMVHVSRGQGDATQVRTGPNGSFSLRGLQPDRWRVYAQASGGRSSDPVEVEVASETPAPALRLVVQAERKLDGQLLAPTGLPIPGAMVIALLDPAVATRIQHATTDADGLFSLSVPRKAASTRLAILPPGFALTSIQVPLQGDSVAPVVVTAGELHGTLQLDFPDAPELAVRTMKVLHDGQELIYSLYLPTWARLQGSPAMTSGLVVPGMPPGEYSVCIGPAETGGCASGYLPPFGELRLPLAQGN